MIGRDGTVVLEVRGKVTCIIIAVAEIIDKPEVRDPNDDGPDLRISSD